MAAEGRSTGRSALVTGASRGSGRAIARRFAREGADVAIAYGTSQEEAQATAVEVERMGRQVRLRLGGITHLSSPSSRSQPDMQLWPMWLDEAGEPSFADAERARAAIERVAGRSTQWHSCQGDRWPLRAGSDYR